MAVPLGVLGAIYLNEYGGNGAGSRRLIGFMSDVMTGVPSIIMGLFIFTIWVLHFGLSGLAGALALACLMLPIVIRSSYEMLRLVPDSLREASYALGASKARVTVTVRAAGGASAASSAAPCSPSPGPRARPRRCCSPSSRRPTVNRNVFSGAEHRAAVADLREREPAVHRRAGPRLGRGAHAHRHLLSS